MIDIHRQGEVAGAVGELEGDAHCLEEKMEIIHSQKGHYKVIGFDASVFRKLFCM